MHNNNINSNFLGLGHNHAPCQLTLKRHRTFYYVLKFANAILTHNKIYPTFISHIKYNYLFIRSFAIDSDTTVGILVQKFAQAQRKKDPFLVIIAKANSYKRELYTNFLSYRKDIPLEACPLLIPLVLGMMDLLARSSVRASIRIHTSKACLTRGVEDTPFFLLEKTPKECW